MVHSNLGVNKSWTDSPPCFYCLYLFDVGKWNWKRNEPKPPHLFSYPSLCE